MEPGIALVDGPFRVVASLGGGRLEEDGESSEGSIVGNSDDDILL
ncbi:hypothetical protein [Methanopyrus kandleri]